MKRILICLFCVVLLCGCNVNNYKKSTQKITIVATNFPIYDFVRAVGGDKIEVKMLIKPGSEVHSYDPLPSDMISICESDLFIYIGGESDNWVETLIGETDINKISLIDCVKEKGHHHKGHRHTDEHIWTSSENAVLMLEKICNEIIKVDGENSKFYRKNCDEYIEEIKTASKEIEKEVKSSEEPFVLVADRFPFLYFAEEYGIEYEAAFDGCAISTDISLKTMARLTDIIETKKIKTVFCTELSNQNIARVLSEELNVNIVELHSAHNVTLDDFNNKITYVDIMYRNKEALERGM